MARNLRKTSKPQSKKTNAARAISIARASAQKAVDAGLEAATSVRQSAVGAFDALVKQGSTSRKAAIAQVLKVRKAALARARKAGKVAVQQANSAKARTVEVVSHLENVFEQRISRAISKLGVPTAKDVRALSRQVAQLQTSVDGLRRSRARAAA